MTTPLLLIAVGALLLLALLVALVVQHRRERAAVPAGPRTVADLVRQRRERAPAAPVVEPTAAAPEAPAGEPATPTPVERVVGRRAIERGAIERGAIERGAIEREAAGRQVAGRPAVERRAAGRPVVEDRAEGPVAAPAPQPVVADPVAPLGDDVPWRRATQITAAGTAEEARPVPGDSRRTPALALLRRPARRDPVSRAAPRRDAPAVPATLVAMPAPVAEPVPAPPPPAIDAAPGDGSVSEAVTPTEPVTPTELITVAESPVAEPIVAEPPTVSGPAVTAPVHEDPAPAVPAPDVPTADVSAPEAPAAATPAVGSPGAGAPVTEPPARPRRDPAHLAAEHAAADLALLRTFGTTDLGSRPDRAPVVALESAPVPETPPAAGAAQPVRFRTVRRDGAAVAGAAVALLDDRGREASTGRSDAAGAGELRAPHPGSYVLVATAPDHQPGAVALTVADSPPAVDVLLVRSAALVGTVTGEDGPLDGARVTVVQDGEIVEATNTDADGRFRVADLAAGEYAVSVAAAGCEPDVDLVSVADEAEQGHDVDLAPAAVPAG